MLQCKERDVVAEIKITAALSIALNVGYASCHIIPNQSSISPLFLIFTAMPVPPLYSDDEATAPLALWSCSMVFSMRMMKPLPPLYEALLYGLLYLLALWPSNKVVPS